MTQRQGRRSVFIIFSSIGGNLRNLRTGNREGVLVRTEFVAEHRARPSGVLRCMVRCWSLLIFEVGASRSAE